MQLEENSISEEQETQMRLTADFVTVDRVNLGLPDFNHLGLTPHKTYVCLLVCHSNEKRLLLIPLRFQSPPFESVFCTIFFTSLPSMHDKGDDWTRHSFPVSKESTECSIGDWTLILLQRHRDLRQICLICKEITDFSNILSWQKKKDILAPDWRLKQQTHNAAASEGKGPSSWDATSCRIIHFC